MNLSEQLLETLVDTSKLDESRILKQLQSNTGADSKAVEASAKVSERGDDLSRMMNIAKINKLGAEKHIKNLADLQDYLGEKVYAVSDALGGAILFELINSKNWTIDQLKMIGWGIPLNAQELYGLDLRD